MPSWPSGEPRSVVVIVGLESIMDNGGGLSGGGMESLLEWPKESSLKREAIFLYFL